MNYLYNIVMQFENKSMARVALSILNQIPTLHILLKNHFQSRCLFRQTRTLSNNLAYQMPHLLSAPSSTHSHVHIDYPRILRTVGSPTQIVSQYYP